MIQLDSKVLPKADDVNAEQTAEPIVKTDPSANSANDIEYNINYFFLLITLNF